MAVTINGDTGIDKVVDNTITTDDIQDGAITAAKIASGVLSWNTTVQTASFTASANTGYFVNTTSNIVTVTLPASPASGEQVAIIDYAGTFATNNLYLANNGLKITGVASNYVLSTNRESIILTYTDATQGWVVSSAAYTTAPIDLLPYTVSYLVVAGGGGGGVPLAGGGGAGGLLSGTATLTLGAVYTATVGAGSPSVTQYTKTNGSNSVLSGTGITTQTAIGGGCGGYYSSPNGIAANSGGSGGGGSVAESGTPGAAGAGTGGQGNSGGAAGNRGGSGSYPGAGGGGGAGAAGGNYSGTTGGAGGAGTASSITGSSVTYAGGGGGSGYNGVGGAGGAGGGGTGSSGTGNSTDGTVNTGGGGGGQGLGSPSTGAAGGSGIVIISVPTILYSGTTTGSPTITTNGSNTVIKFTASGTYTA